MGLEVDGVSSSAATPTNRIITCKPVGFGITTPGFPASDLYAVNTTSFAVVCTILTPGIVANWELKDANGMSQGISGPLLAGQAIYLEPGDAD